MIKPLCISRVGLSPNLCSALLSNSRSLTINGNDPLKDYSVGTTFQPDEHRLPLMVRDLELLNKALQRLGDNPIWE